MSSFPFYSSQAREALVKIISNHPNDDHSAGVASSASLLPTTTLRPGTAIRGKWGGYDSSSDDDGVGNNDAAGSDDESTSSASSMEVIQESEESASANTATATQQPQKGKSAHKPNKKSKNRKSKDDILQKIGKAPSILLPIHDDITVKNNNSAKKKEALEVPNVLLPPNYLRDNPNWKTPSIAKSLLKNWDQLSNTISSSSPTIIVVLLQSGRFAAAVFSLQNKKVAMMTMLAHKTSTRYTVRKGQGGSQSSNDQSKGKAKSVGSQLRREGEKQLREDVQSTWKEWHNAGYVQRALWVYVSCPKGMKRDHLFGGGEDGNVNDALVEKTDGRLRNIPLDVGRPTMEGTAAVVDCVLNCSLREMTEEEVKALRSVDEDEDGVKADSTESVAKEEEAQVEEEVEETPEPEPLNPLHQAVLDGDLERLMELLKLLDETEEQTATTESNDKLPSETDYDINTTGGLDNQTPLHLASSSSHANATSILNALLIQGHANPCTVDSRGRPPYFLATSDKNRETFRLARGKLGEDYCSWDDEAKVGPPLTEDDVQAKKAKALEKKRRQRARQKEKKANEKAAAEEEVAAKHAEEEKKKQEMDAKRIRDGLKPKSSAASNACDFCQKVVKGKRRSQMFQRLDYAYCSTDCVKKHQRELMAAAAAARMG